MYLDYCSVYLHMCRTMTGVLAVTMKAIIGMQYVIIQRTSANVVSEMDKRH